MTCQMVLLNFSCLFLYSLFYYLFLRLSHWIFPCQPLPSYITILFLILWSSICFLIVPYSILPLCGSIDYSLVIIMLVNNIHRLCVCSLLILDISPLFSNVGNFFYLINIYFVLMMASFVLLKFLNLCILIY